MVNQRTERWAVALADIFTQLFGATYAVSKAYDTNSDVYVKVALAAGGNNTVKAIVKLVPATAPASGAKDSLGLTQTVFGPHVAQVLFDITASSTSTTERFIVQHEVDKLGARIELFEKTAGAGNIAIADIAAGQFVTGLDFDVPFGALANQ